MVNVLSLVTDFVGPERVTVSLDVFEFEDSFVSVRSEFERENDTDTDALDGYVSDNESVGPDRLGDLVCVRMVVRETLRETVNSFVEESDCDFVNAWTDEGRSVVMMARNATAKEAKNGRPGASSLLLHAGGFELFIFFFFPPPRLVAPQYLRERKR